MPQGALEEQTHHSLPLGNNERVLYVGGDRPIRISAGHRILHNDGKCRRLYGYNYPVSVGVTGTLTKKG